MNNFRGGFGGGFNGANLQNLMRQAQKMQEEMEKAKLELESTEFTGTSGGNMVEVVMTGDKKAKKVTVNKRVEDVTDKEQIRKIFSK